MRQLGGALGRPDPDGGALSHLDAGWVDVRDRDADDAASWARRSRANSTRVHDAMEPWAADGGYFNFAERPCDADEILPPEVCGSLADVKRQ